MPTTRWNALQNRERAALEAARALRAPPRHTSARGTLSDLRALAATAPAELRAELAGVASRLETALAVGAADDVSREMLRGKRAMEVVLERR